MTTTRTRSAVIAAAAVGLLWPAAPASAGPDPAAIRKCVAGFGSYLDPSTESEFTDRQSCLRHIARGGALSPANPEPELLWIGGVDGHGGCAVSVDLFGAVDGSVWRVILLVDGAQVLDQPVTATTKFDVGIFVAPGSTVTGRVDGTAEPETVVVDAGCSVSEVTACQL